MQRVEPGPGQESVWDYPRPPRLEASTRHVLVTAGRVSIADTTRAIRVLETSHPPVYYIPREDCDEDCLSPAPGGSWCEWKGRAAYWDVTVGSRTLVRAAWSYPEPLPAFESIRDHLAFYPAIVRCSIDGERVTPQPGGFYGGWITSEVVGPFKGAAGTDLW